LVGKGRDIRTVPVPGWVEARSSAYFRPVVDELRSHPAPESYLDYLRLKLRQARGSPGGRPRIYVF
jgi:hypothetical protein